MKKYKKVKDKIISTETVEIEIDVKSIENRIETLDKAISDVKNQFDRLNTQTNTYEVEKAGLEEELKQIKKLK